MAGWKRDVALGSNRASQHCKMTADLCFHPGDCGEGLAWDDVGSFTLLLARVIVITAGVGTRGFVGKRIPGMANTGIRIPHIRGSPQITLLT